MTLPTAEGQKWNLQGPIQTIPWFCDSASPISSPFTTSRAPGAADTCLSNLTIQQRTGPHQQRGPSLATKGESAPKTPSGCPGGVKPQPQPWADPGAAGGAQGGTRATNTSSTLRLGILQTGLSSAQGVQVRGINSPQFTKLSLSGLQFPRSNKSSSFPFLQSSHSAALGQMETDGAPSKVQPHTEPGPRRLLLTGCYSHGPGSK